MNDQKTDDPIAENPPQEEQSMQMSDFSERNVQPESTTVETESPTRTDAPSPIASEIEQPTGLGAVAGTMSAPMGMPTAVPPTPPVKKSKKPLIIAGVVAVIALGLIGGSAYAYTLYQKPQNVLLQAAGNALSAKKLRTKTVVTSDFAYDADGTKLSFEKVTFETGSERTPRYDMNAEIVAKYNDKQVTLKGDVLATDAGELYFRVSNIKDTLQKVLPADMKMNAMAEAYLAQIDGKWAKYTLEDLKKDSPDYGKTVQCVLDVYKKHKDDKKSIQEVVELYKANQFVVVKGEPTSKNGNFGYEVAIDNKKSKAFSKEVAKTALAKEVEACDKNAAASASASEDTDTTDTVDTPTNADGPVTTTTLWISKWGHELRSVETKTTDIKGVDNKKYSITSRTDVDFGNGVVTTSPKDTVPLKAWSENATKFMTELSRPAASKAQAANEANKVAAGAESYAANNRGTYPATYADMQRYVTLASGTTVVAELPKTATQIGYKLCSARNGQVIYKTDTGYQAVGVGSGKSGAVTQFCA